MSKRLDSKYKISRRLGENLWGRAKDPVLKRDYGPGQHGPARRRKLSDYGLQLRAKQKLRGYYGSINERQFRKIYQEAVRRKGDTSENLVGILESRLDAFVFRMGVVPTVFAARQFINHGHITLNGKKANISSIQLKEGDVVQVKEKSRQMNMVLEAMKNAERTVPDYIEMDNDNLKGKFIRVPKFMEIPYPVKMEPNLVIEFYSR
ncbi:MAG: 30S ribosomal protein S4 [Rickettsiales bacterium]